MGIFKIFPATLDRLLWKMLVTGDSYFVECADFIWIILTLIMICNGSRYLGKRFFIPLWHHMEPNTLVTISSGRGFSPVQRQAISWANAIWFQLDTNEQWYLITIQTFKNTCKNVKEMLTILFRLQTNSGQRYLAYLNAFQSTWIFTACGWNPVGPCLIDRTGWQWPIERHLTEWKDAWLGDFLSIGC